MYAEQQLRDLIELARRAGATMVVTYDQEARAKEGREIIETVTVHDGIPGIGNKPMSGFAAFERLYEAKCCGLLGPVIIEARIDPLPRPMPAGMRDPLPKVHATLSNRESITLFEFYPDEIQFHPDEFVGKTVDEAKRLKATKDSAYLRDRDDRMVAPGPGPRISVEEGICASDQESSFMNATLQTVGQVAFSVATFINVPVEIANQGEAAVKDFVSSVLRDAVAANPAFTFEVQIGPEDHSEKLFPRPGN